MIIRNRYILLTFLIFTLVTIYSLNIPFFWDGTFFSEIAVNFYDKGFNNFIIPDVPDTGGFPMYSAYLAFAWKIFGKTLPVSHLSVLPLILGIVYSYYLLASRFLKREIIPIALVLLICEPCFMTQSILMGYDILMIFFFMLSLNALLSEKKLPYSLFLVLLCLSSMRGIMLGISLLLIDVLVYKKINFAFFKPYILSFLAVIFWAFYHNKITGWFFFSPERENTDEATLPLNLIFRQFIYIIWKINDLGRVLLWIFLGISGILLYRKNKTDEWNTILKILFVPLIILTVLMVSFSNPVGQRYFIVIFLLLNIAVCYLLQSLRSNKLILGVSLVFSFALITGNFWMYPQKYGNGWDVSLKVIPYFDLKDKMDAFIVESGIPPEKIGTQFPLIADKRFSYLTDNEYHYTDVWSGPLDNHSYFLYTNVINTNIAGQIDDMKKSWQLIKQMKSGQVVIALYKNAYH